MGSGSSTVKLITSTTRLDGKTAVITGCNTGIGKITAKEFYRIGARVIMACRDLSRAEAAAEEIRTEIGTAEGVGSLEIQLLDLSSLASVRSCANQILAAGYPIHLLVNNAGVMMVPKGKTEDCFETHFGVNHLGHFLFTCLLLPRILQSTPARIINVSSRAYANGTICWEDLNWEKRLYSPFKAYCQSKLANVLFTIELANRLKGKGVTVYSVHPGVVKTELGRHLDETYFRGARAISAFLFSGLFKTPEQGAMTTLFCALDPAAGEQTGLYYSDCKVKEPFAVGKDEIAATRLWRESAIMVDLGEEVEKVVGPSSVIFGVNRFLVHVV